MRYGYLDMDPAACRNLPELDTKQQRDKQRREFKAKVGAQYKEVSKRFPPARGLKDLKTVRDLISRIERIRMAS